MDELNQEWENFFNDVETKKEEKKEVKNDFKPNCSDIYISTRTKTGALDKEIDLETIFWKLPIVNYHEAKSGILKKIIKINSKTDQEVRELEQKLKNEKIVNVDIISKVDNITGDFHQFKDVRKIIVGISKKDLINFRKKKKSAFYNCFSLIIRIKHNNIFKEINIKLFNTGRLKIPGIKDIETMNLAINQLTTIINSISENKVRFVPEHTETVLINSNFTCNFYIVRNKLHQILKYKYNIHSLYDPCSYPGIQCKFFYNKNNTTNDGLCHCKNKCELNNKKKKKNNNCSIISFMIFRTGSILIVGNCDEDVLYIIYDFIKNILITECENGIKSNTICDEKKKSKEKKFRKRIIMKTC